MDKISSQKPTPKKKLRRWSKSEEVNGISKSLSVREVENGFVVEYSRYGRDSMKPESEYVDENKTYISKTNPLEDSEEEKEEEKDKFSLGNIDMLLF